MKDLKKLEVLAPAGSYESMKAAVAAGADAVYMGGSRFGARAYADNPDEDGLLKAIDYVHLHGSRLYMTVNTLFKEEELGELYQYLLPYYKEGLDAVIVQDLGAMAYIRRNFPGLEIHASTQMTITGAHGAKLLKELGASRVVTARELSLDEIRRIRREVDVEIESFVHGALCYCYSGQCLMSSLIGGRSGNRGRCAQPCRLPYEVRSRDEQSGPAVNKKNERYVLSLKDLCTLDLIPELAGAGINSLKIEGRMKSPRYTAGVVSIYRKYVDLFDQHGSGGYYVEPEDKKLLADLFDRGGFTQGYYKQHNGREMVALKEKPAFREGNQQLFDYLDKTYVEAELKEPVTGRAFFEEGCPAVLELQAAAGETAVSIRVKGQAPQRAQNQPMTEEKILKQLGKTGNTPFRFTDLKAEIKGDLFMPVQALNELRREGLEALEQAMLDIGRRKAAGGESAVGNSADSLAQTAAGKTADSPAHTTAGKTADSPAQAFPASPFQLYASLEEPSQLPPVLRSTDISGVYLDAGGFAPERWAAAVQSCKEAGKACLLTLPHIFRSHSLAFFEQYGSQLRAAGFDGVLVRSPEEIRWLGEQGLALPMVFDAGVYCWNSSTVRELKALGARRITMPWELNSREMQPVAGALRQQNTEAELVIYGRIPMMVSSQCIKRTTGGCTKKRETLLMKDRTGALLPVKNHCAFCYNTIYNTSPVSLLGSEAVIRKLGITTLRLNFTTENEEEVSRIVRAFGDSFLRELPVAQPFKDFTRGHFKRGVQ